jgi:hypothetical protein
MVERKRRLGGWRTIRRVLALGGLAAAAVALIRQVPAPVTATGKPGIPPSRQALESGFEVKDIDERSVVYILGAVAATTALAIGIVAVMIWHVDSARTRSFAGLSQQQTAQSVPPAPHLQINAFADLARQRVRESRLLHSYGWTSADHGTARIPIDRAMALTVGQSLDAPPW